MFGRQLGTDSSTNGSSGSTEIKRPVSTVHLDEGIVHGHIHNCNNITYVHGHIHHNVQLYPNVQPSSSTGPLNNQSEGFVQGTSTGTNTNTVASMFPGGSNGGSTNLFPPPQQQPQSQPQPQQKFRETQHFEFIDYNNASNNRIFATGLLNSSDSLLFELPPRFTPNNDKVPIREPEPYNIPLYDTVPINKKQKRSIGNGNNIAYSNGNTVTATAAAAADLTNLDDCYCNPKFLEICCELPHDNISPPNNISNANTKPIHNHNHTLRGTTARSNSAPIVLSPTLSGLETSLLPSINFVLDPQAVTDITGTDKVGVVSTGLNIIDCDFSCELEDGVVCNDDDNNNCNNNNSSSISTSKEGSIAANSSSQTGYENEDEDEDEDEDVFDKFCKICQRLGKSQTDGESCNHVGNLPHLRLGTPLEGVAVSKKRKKKRKKHEEKGQNGVNSRISNRELDMKVLQDLCNISSLYEIPFANHMSHHHYLGAPTSVSDSSANVSTTSAAVETTSNPLKDFSDDKSQGHRCTSSHIHNHNHHHHHHIVELHNHYPANPGDKRLTNVISRHSTPSNPVLVDRQVSYERHSRRDVKPEPGSEVNILNFNWNFKNMILDDGTTLHSSITNSRDPTPKIDETARAQTSLPSSSSSTSSSLHVQPFARVSTPDIGIACEWDDCNQTDFSSLIDLQKHLYRDHIAESQTNCSTIDNYGLQQQEQQQQQQIQGCRWKGCDFKGTDICHLVNHINNEHGINFDMKFVDLDGNSNTGTTTSTNETKTKTNNPQEQEQQPKFECLWGPCHEKFPAAEHLNKHLETKHLTRGKSHYVCHWDNCNKTFTQRQKLVRHLRVHSRFKPFRCEFCNRCFSSNETLKQHLRIHSGEKPYECPYCKKRFTVSSTLKVHIRTHTGEKPLECKICHKRFSESSNLNKHMRVHFKQFKCEWCLEKFGTLKKLEVHQRSCCGGVGVGVDASAGTSMAVSSDANKAAAATSTVVNI